MRDTLFVPGQDDPRGQQAGAMDSALSMLIGIAACESARLNRPVIINPLALDPDGLSPADQA